MKVEFDIVIVGGGIAAVEAARYFGSFKHEENRMITNLIKDY